MLCQQSFKGAPELRISLLVSQLCVRLVLGTMKLFVYLVLLSLLCASADMSPILEGGRFAWDAARGKLLLPWACLPGALSPSTGAWDMFRAYKDMREANYIGADKYFHARGNYDAAQRGPGGAWAAKVISDARERWQGGVSGRGAEDTRADQEANEWGRNGGDPNRYRPAGLPSKY
uniref:Serum amyloid A protein n=1 Tax=Calidris pygmaea TaxID=425635 RepID=A0A8C3PIB7_9CHAR